MVMNIDREQIFQLTHKKEWIKLLKLVQEYYRHGSSDEVLMTAVKTFEDQFFEELDKGAEINNLEILLKEICLLHETKINKLSENRFCRIVVELVKIYRKEKSVKSSQTAYSYAKKCPTHEVCADFIRLHEESSRKVVGHSQSNQIRVTENREIANVDCTISLFKSHQEFEFFMAVREVFQMFLVYPNVALSCVIDFEKIKPHLSKEQKNFFFKGIIDCIVFDQSNNYQPVKIFELDSSYHDRPEQQQRDSYKDKILSLAGQKLYRIRKTSNHQGRKEFIQLIREIVLSPIL
ncbi:MAG TPA: hypothetical protein DCF68_08865 [Cyanothece sp. UBA12306]|nr:hypothetical protein [Cyanothece sp. UBA12306]